jgi:arylsulfatase A-like enzyme
MSHRPNILYIHSHDTGRYIEPYGYAIPTPRLQGLAEEGVLFRNNHCVNPTCSPSRASLLTGTYPHENGMFGLAHRGWALNDYREHLIHLLRKHGYTSALAGIQHIADHTGGEPWKKIGYDEHLGNHDVAETAAAEWLSRRDDTPFFLSVGFFETHREFPELTEAETGRAAYVRPPAPLPDTPTTRLDMAAYAKSAATLDRKIGVVLDALEQSGKAENTLVVCTTDHGIAFPKMKCNLTDHGTGTMLIVRGPGGFSGGRVVDAMTSHLDIYPTICELLDIEPPHALRGSSLLPLIAGTAERLHDELFFEVNYHASYEPMRSVRTERYRYIRRFDGRFRPVLPNIDNGPSKEYLVANGFDRLRPPEEMLFDLVMDPNESNNVIADPTMAGVAADLRSRLDRFMQETDDPLREGYVLPSATARVTWPDASSPSGPVFSP